ncbi:MAG: adenylate/guanylate cyclase domain-containing protein, partial [Alphaproteobacteria bacterium]|nr:adenylate/guanylate cyclase domain-containing protein [Alphaproteobacteria bacterium]
MRDRPTSLHDWLVGAAWECSSPGALTAAYGQALNAAGVPVWRVQVGLRTLHPLLVAENHTWRADADAVQVAYATRETVSSDAFLRSPLAPLYEGAGAIRCRLAGEHAALDYPVLHGLAAAGATDYAALPMSFSDGQLNAVTFATRDARGFTTEALGRISASVGLLGRLFEVHILRATACTLLDTYLGQR